MRGEVLLLLCLMLLMVAAALWLWQASVARTRRTVTSAFVERQLGRAMPASAEPDVAVSQYRSRQSSGFRGGWENLLLRAGIAPGPGYYMPVVLALVILPATAFLFGGLLGATITFILVLAVSYFRLSMAASKRRSVMVRQLPGFLDALVRLIVIGNSLGSAFHTAVNSADQPLLEVLDRANQLNRAGMELDASLSYVARLYRFHELELVAAVVGVALRFGGRSDMVLERMAGFMRDLQQAREELHAMSAEIRLSAWILGLLPVCVAGFIVVVNNAMFMGTWDDPTGKKMLIGAVVLQLTGSYWLYRMAKSV